MSSPSPQSSSSYRRIRQLPRQLANQIAAGEVIERPASVVKELVENSIDAKSTQIDIVIERGGTQLIQVSDNGHGIDCDDLPLALSPHATSKIYTLEELNQIYSLGFRGEALASIASISRITLQSRQSESAMGWMVNESQSDSKQEPKPCAIPVGSRIAVRELFFNTPGRKRFLRTDRTEFLQIESMVRRLALSHFEIGFSLEHNGKKIFRLPAATNDEQRLQRIGQLFGKAFSKSVMQIRFEAGGMVLSGWVGTPDFSITQSDRQYFYLNGRGMRDKVISHAIRHVYQSFTPEGRHPAYLLNLEIDPEQVDVNVHPTKHEVRFRQGRMVHDFISTSLLRALDEGGGSVDFKQVDTETGEIYPSPAPGSQHSLVQVAETQADYQKNVELERGRAAFLKRSGTERFSLIAQRYLLFIIDGEHYLSDLNSLYERVLDEAFASITVAKKLDSRPLLFPEKITVAADILDAIGNEKMQLSVYGVSLERQGADVVILRALPQLLNATEYQDFVVAMFNQWESAKLPELLKRLIKEFGLKAIADPTEYSEQTSRWLKRFSMRRLAELVGVGETVKLESGQLAKLFN